MYNFIVSQIDPTCDTYVLESLGGHSRGTQFLIFNLVAFSVSEFLISFGKISHIFGARKETDSVPYLTEFTLRLFQKLFPRKL